MTQAIKIGESAYPPLSMSDIRFSASGNQKHPRFLGEIYRIFYINQPKKLKIPKPETAVFRKKSKLF